MSYPSIPAQAQTGLLLFGCAFKGENDGRFLHEAGLTCTVVDIDPVRIEAMRPHYPESWRYVCADAFRFVHDASLRGVRWDVVSADPFTDEATRTLDMIENLYRLSSFLCVVGVRHEDENKAKDAGFSMIKRNDQWSWAYA